MEIHIQNLPDTQTSDEVVYSQVPDEDIPVVWGMLYAAKKTFKSHELLEDEYTIGRSALCQIPLTIREVKHEDVLSTVSKVHCRIKRETSVVFLEDLSFNGTFVNGERIGKGQKVVLQNNDRISLASPGYKVYIFMDPSTYTNQDYPSEITQRFVVSHVLGTGAFGEVKMVFEKRTCKQFALKMITKEKLTSGGKHKINNDTEKILNEVNIMKALRHPSVVHICDVLDTPRILFIVLELMEGGELYDRIIQRKQLKESETKFLFYQMVLAVQYLHEKGIAHRDLKPENVLLASETPETLVKISDFGLSKIFSSQAMLTTFCGTPMYVAPEILETQGRGTYTNQVDVWSLGVILYCCLSGHTPFLENNMGMNLYEQIVTGTYSFSPVLWSGMSAEVKDLVRRMLTINPKRRITINKVTSHPWMQDETMKKKVSALYKLATGDENQPPQKKAKIM